MVIKMKKIIAINGVLVEVDNDRVKNREDIRDRGENLRLKIAELRLLGQDDCSTDIEELSLLLSIIAHDAVHGQHETIDDRKKTLFNIARTATLLSNRAQPGELEKFKEKYIAFDERSIWRDIEFLHKMLTSQDDIYYNNYFIPDYRVKKILEHDIPKLAQIVSNELNDTLSDVHKQEMRALYKNTTLLSYIYEIVNYYREEEALQKILKYTDSVFLLQIDPATLEGRLAIFRVLEVIGEYSTQKDLTEVTRDSDDSIDWNLLVAVRNRLAHHEWYLAYSNVMQGLLNRDLEEILAVDIPFIRQRIEVIWHNHQAVQAKVNINGRAFDRAVTDYFVKHQASAALSDEAKQFITQHCEWLLQNNFINREEFLNILQLIQGDLRAIDVKTMLFNYIGEAKFTKGYLDELAGENLNALRDLDDIISEFNQIQGELTRTTNINKAKVKTSELFKYLETAGIINKQELATFKEQVRNSANLEGLLRLVVEIPQQHDFTVNETVVEILQLHFKISDKKKSDDIRDLYNLLKEKDFISQERMEEITEIIRKIKSNEISGKDGSAQINDIKLQVIDSYLQIRGLDSITRERVALSESYYKLISYIRPSISEGLKEHIIKFCLSLVQSKVTAIDDTKVAELIKLLQGLQIQDFLLALRQAIGEERFSEEYKERLKSAEIIQLERMKQIFGEISDRINQERELFKHQQERVEWELARHKKQCREHHLDHFRALKDSLPNDEGYKDVKQKQPLLEQLKVLQHALSAIQLLEQLFNEVVFPSLVQVHEGFSEERQFLHIPQELWDRMQGGTYNDARYIEALQKLQNYFKTSAIPIPLKNRLITNEDDIVSSRPVKNNMSEEEVQLYINQNIGYIIEETIHYSHFIDTCQTLRTNPVLTLAIEYATSVIWPYLSETQREYLGGMPNMLQRELKAQRNVVKHGNIYVDLLVPDRLDEFLVRYASIFTKDLKPLLERIDSSLSTYNPQQFDINQDLWYGDEHIDGLLNTYLADDDYAVIAPTVFNNTDFLRTNTIAAINAALAGQIVVMPINLHGNHWVGAMMHVRDNVLHLVFNNPLGTAIEQEPNAIAFIQTIQTAMLAINPNAILNMIDLMLPQQQNGDDCGPFTVDNLIRLAELAREHPLNIIDWTRAQIIDEAELQQPENGSADEIRGEHNQIFEEQGLDIPGNESPADPEEYQAFQNNRCQLEDEAAVRLCLNHESKITNPETTVDFNAQDVVPAVELNSDMQNTIAPEIQMNNLDLNVGIFVGLLTISSEGNYI